MEKKDSELTNWIQCGFCIRIVKDVKKNYSVFLCGNIVPVCKRCDRKKPWEKNKQYFEADE